MSIMSVRNVVFYSALLATALALPLNERALPLHERALVMENGAAQAGVEASELPAPAPAPAPAQAQAQPVDEPPAAVVVPQYKDTLVTVVETVTAGQSPPPQQAPTTPAVVEPPPAPAAPAAPPSTPYTPSPAPPPTTPAPPPPPPATPATPPPTTPAPPPPATPAPASPAASPAPPSGYIAPNSGSRPSHKKGLAFNDVSQLTPWANQNSIGWTYDWWATDRTGIPSSMEYYPMMWCPTKWTVEAWTAAANKAIASGSRRVLGFNEPDLAPQCNIAVSDAVAGHIKYMNQFKGKALVSSPAVTNGGGDQGLGYLSNFFQQCAGRCVVDFLAIHWYSGSQGGVQYFKNHVSDAIKLAEANNVPEVWITEFGLTDGSDADKADFVNQVLPWLDAQPKVGGYSYFFASDGILNSGSSISPVLGKAYAASS